MELSETFGFHFTWNGIIPCLAASTEVSALSGERSLFQGQRIGGLLRGQLLLDGNAGLAEGVKDLGFKEARGIVFESEAAAGIVHMETPEAVEIGEFAKALQLLVAERRTEFEGDFDKCHAGDYSSAK